MPRQRIRQPKPVRRGRTRDDQRTHAPARPVRTGRPTGDTSGVDELLDRIDQQLADHDD